MNITTSLIQVPRINNAFSIFSLNTDWAPPIESYLDIHQLVLAWPRPNRGRLKRRADTEPCLRSKQSPLVEIHQLPGLTPAPQFVSGASAPQAVRIGGASAPVIINGGATSTSHQQQHLQILQYDSDICES